MRSQFRVWAGRESTPSASSIDTQSVRTTKVGDDARGYGSAKKIKGRKRHPLVNPRALLIVVVVTAANLDDGTAALKRLSRVTVKDMPRLKVIFGDNKYRNNSLNAWLKSNRPQWTIEVQSPPLGTKGFIAVHKRWVVERTNGWHDRSRHTSKDYERTTESAEAMIRFSPIHLTSSVSFTDAETTRSI